jgi:type I restriction enzyme M protein
MNMILHDFSTANIASGGEGTLVKLRFLNGKQLRTFDYVVRLRRRQSALSR